MPRIIVTSDHPASDDAVVLLDEHVASAQLSDDRDASRFIERLGWAISDAEDSGAGARVEPPPALARARRALRRVRGPEPARRGGDRARNVVASLLPRELA